VSPANFLLLDEPTNHLDLRAKDVLLEAIGKFNGTVIFVSHDRYFIDGLAQKVFEIERNVEDPSRGSRLNVYPGNYEDYRWRKEGGAAELAAATMAAAEPVVHAPVAVVVSEPVIAEKAAKRVNPIKLRQMQERLAAVEAEIPRVESSLAETEQALAVYVSTEETQRLSNALTALRAQQASLNSEWEELSMQVEQSL
jgi:ATP-binding cassette subfamily F protein 3